MSMRGDDFAVRMDAAVRFSSLIRRGRGILATGVRRESRAIMLGGSSLSPTGLCGRSAETSGDDLPVVAVDAGRGQMQHDAPHRGFDSSAELHQMLAQSVDLGRSEGGLAVSSECSVLEDVMRSLRRITQGDVRPQFWIANVPTLRRLG